MKLGFYIALVLIVVSFVNKRKEDIFQIQKLPDKTNQAGELIPHSYSALYIRIYTLNTLGQVIYHVIPSIVCVL